MGVLNEKMCNIYTIYLENYIFRIFYKCSSESFKGVDK